MDSSPQASTPVKQKPTPSSIKLGMERLQERLNELQAFDLSTVSNAPSPILTRLSAAIGDTLERCFGLGTSAFERYRLAIHLQPKLFRIQEPGYYRDYARKSIERSVLLLSEAQRALLEDLKDAEQNGPLSTSHTPVSVLSRRVFVVHGHDSEARETVARFLDKIGFDPIILHEQASQNRTVIEKIEAYDDVGFAVVLLTPDDEGRAKGGELQPRARQNVLLELGYFMGRLGRDKVCALRRGEVEIPSDFAGVVWVAMDTGNGWKQALGQELQAVGHDVDWNQVMRP